MSIYAFGPFELDIERLLLLHEGEPVALGPKVVETLLALIEHPGDVLAKGALLDRIWPEGFVEEANLAQNIYVLRKTMRAHWHVDAIETVPRRGYRFVGPVDRVEKLPAPPPAVHDQAPVPRVARRFAAGVAVAAFVAVALAFGISYSGAHRANAAGGLSVSGARLYAIGHYYWNLRTRVGVEKSLSYFADVVDSDPHDARGYAGLAEANVTMADYRYGSQPPKIYLSRAGAYAEKALALDADSAEAHAALGFIKLDRHDLSGAVAELRRAIAIDPSYGPAHEWYGVALLGHGSLHDGLHQLQLAADLDPLSVATTVWLGSAAYLDHHFNEAIAYSRQALDLSPERIDAYAIIGEAYEAEGNYPRAIEAFKRYGAGSTYSRPESAALLSHVYALLHRQSDARRELTYAKQHADDVDPEDLALALDATGDRKVALSLLRRKRDPMSMMAIENDPRFDTLRHDAQFRQITAPA